MYGGGGDDIKGKDTLPPALEEGGKDGPMAQLGTMVNQADQDSNHNGSIPNPVGLSGGGRRRRRRSRKKKRSGCSCKKGFFGLF